VFERLRELGYEVRFLSHAEAILRHDFPEVEVELEASLVDFRIPIAEIIGSGGGEAAGTQRLRRSLAGRHWVKTNFELVKTINGVPRESISHEVDHVRRFEREEGSLAIAMEIEWNNKDPFFDRDLENFKRLHTEGGISVGIILTRGTSLQNNMRDLVLRFATERNITSFAELEELGLEPTSRQRRIVKARMTRLREPMLFPEAWTGHFVADKFGPATTHWRKLMDRVDRGVGNPCPLLLIGLPDTIVTFSPDHRIVSPDIEEDDVAAE
jgi:hypothetical protein